MPLLAPTGPIPRGIRVHFRGAAEWGGEKEGRACVCWCVCVGVCLGCGEKDWTGPSGGVGTDTNQSIYRQTGKGERGGGAMSLQEGFCSLLLPVDTSPPTTQQLAQQLESEEVEERVEAMRRVLGLLLQGENVRALLVPILKGVMTCRDRRLQRLLFVYWENINREGADGTLLPDLLLIPCVEHAHVLFLWSMSTHSLTPIFFFWICLHTHTHMHACMFTSLDSAVCNHTGTHRQKVCVWICVLFCLHIHTGAHTHTWMYVPAIFMSVFILVRTQMQMCISLYFEFYFVLVHTHACT